MPNLSFRRRFSPRIRDGSKRHTIRGLGARPFKVGDDLYLWQEQRFNPEWIGYTTCSGVEPIRIDAGTIYGTLEISVCGVRYSEDEAAAFAVLDGFGNMREMYDYWVREYGLEALPMDGQIIHWEFPLRPREESPAAIARERRELRRQRKEQRPHK